MNLSIAINSYKNAAMLRLCLESLKIAIEKIECEVIVTDGETDEETELMMNEDFPEVKFISFKKNVGFQVMLNAGASQSSGKFVLFLNSDIVVEKNSIKKLLDFIQKHPEVGIVGPRLLNFNGTLQHSCFRFYRPLTVLYRRTFLKNFNFARRHLDWFLMKDYDQLEPRAVDWVMGSAMMVSSRAIKKVGLMDPRFFMYMEDVDWCRRFWENGFKVYYFPEAVMHHYHGKGSAKGGFFHSVFFNRLTWIHIASAVKYFAKYHGRNLPQIN